MQKFNGCNGKKVGRGELDEDSSPGQFKNSLTSLKHTIFRELHWSLNDIDQCDFFNLLSFIQYSPKQDRNTRVIDGKVYHRVNANKPPSWL